MRWNKVVIGAVLGGLLGFSGQFGADFFCWDTPDDRKTPYRFSLMVPLTGTCPTLDGRRSGRVKHGKYSIKPIFCTGSSTKERWLAAQLLSSPSFALPQRLHLIENISPLPSTHPQVKLASQRTQSPSRKINRVHPNAWTN